MEYVRAKHLTRFCEFSGVCKSRAFDEVLLSLVEYARAEHLARFCEFSGVCKSRAFDKVLRVC
ncbi:hypothetical protein [Butyrivibrio sp. JL13D10]|uniref:hypothetical protein n=1 Tax=Butyrivibrio sp. JL13D10 TaxID=3236815 RepID=UPI0038B4834D